MSIFASSSPVDLQYSAIKEESACWRCNERDRHAFYAKILHGQKETFRKRIFIIRAKRKKKGGKHTL